MQKEKVLEENYLHIATSVSINNNKMKEDIIREIELPEGVSASFTDGVLQIKGPKGENSRKFSHPAMQSKVEQNKVVLLFKKGTRREKKLISSFTAHIKNMVAGVQEAHKYLVKICSGHFPMNVAISGSEIVIKNFLGESVPRKAQIIDSTEVKIDGTQITITSCDKEKAGQMAARIESLCRITNRDRRIFQDGCYIIEKAGKAI